MNKTNKTLSNAEIVTIVIAGVFAVAGIFFGVVGIIGRYLSDGNWIAAMGKAINTFFKSTLSLGLWGTILLAIGLVIYLVASVTFARRSDLDAEKQARRAQRLELEQAAESQPVIDAEVQE